MSSAAEKALRWIEQSGAMCDDYWETPDGLDCCCGCRELIAALASEVNSEPPASDRRPEATA